MRLKVEVYMFVNDKPKTLVTKLVAMDIGDNIEDCIKEGARVFELFVEENPRIAKDLLGVKSTLVIW